MGQVIRGGEQFETHIEADHRGQLVQQGPDSGLALSLGQTIDGTSDILILTLQCSSSEDATGLLGWRELV